MKEIHEKLAIFMRSLKDKKWHGVTEAADAVSHELVSLGFSFKRPYVWKEKARPAGDGDEGGICCEYQFGKESLGMVLMEWLATDVGYRIAGDLVPSPLERERYLCKKCGISLNHEKHEPTCLKEGSSELCDCGTWHITAGCCPSCHSQPLEVVKQTCEDYGQPWVNAEVL
jgi:hypothetical protein